MTVTCLYIFEVVNFVHHNKGELFSPNSEIHNHNIRRNADVFIRVESPYNKYMKIYNALPHELKSLSVTKFNKETKAKFTSDVFYSLKEYYESIKL